MTSNTYSYDGHARRIDLKLRSEFIDLDTTIFKLDNNLYKIFIEKDQLEFDIIKKKIDAIKPLTMQIELISELPAKFVKKLDKINDTEISKDFEGMFLSRLDTINLLSSKFPQIHFHSISQEDNAVVIYVCQFEKQRGNIKDYIFLNEDDKTKISTFLNQLKLPVNFIIKEIRSEPQKLEVNNTISPVHYMYSPKHLPSKLSECLERDEAIWFDNVDKIFKSEFKKQDLFFFDEEEYSCYADYSTFKNVNLRTLLFLFETIFISLPVEQPINFFLAEQKITKDELIELINKNRIKIIVVQPTNRQDIDFLHEVFTIAPQNIITRRAIATLQQADIIEISDNYIFNNPDCLKELKVLAEIVGKLNRANIDHIYKLLAWPIEARRKSFEALNIKGPFGTAIFGINNVVEPTISKLINKDLSFDFTVNAQNIHIANALNAIYFPFKDENGYSDFPYANTIGSFLNLVRNFTSSTLSSLVNYEENINSGILPLTLINTIETNNYIPITDLEKVLSKDTINPSSRRLMHYLSKLNDEERKRVIEKYNHEINEKILKKEKRAPQIDLIQNLGIDGAGYATSLPFLGTVISLFKITSRFISKKFPEIKNTIYRLEEGLYNGTDKKNIHFLTKVNRVARLRNYQ